jgi:DNA (cytosine-5)-methyltransferase 1
VTVAARNIPFRRAADGTYEVNAADLFCGAGGTSTGLVEAVEELEQLYGVKIRLSITAVNHWPVAIETHSANHRFAQHHCSGLKGVKPRDVIRGPLDLLVASPECTHHSNARGGKPMDDQSRSSGDDVVRWISELRPGMVLIENVREYRSWGPLDEKNRPIKSRKGEYFQRFLAQIRALGYSTEDRLLCAADYGDPTTRLRLFVLCRRGGGVISWPTQTHAKNPEKGLLPGLQPWRAARELIDWNDRGKSIFNRPKPLKPNTMRRIAAGLYKFSGLDLREYLASEFLVKLYGTSTVSPVDKPVPTVTGGGNHLYVVKPFVLGQQSPAAPRSTDEPMPTVAAAGAISKVEPYVVQYNGTADAKSVEDPLPTATGKDRFGMAEPFIVANFNERDGQKPRVHDIDAPAPTVTPRGMGDLAVPFVVPMNHDNPPVSVDAPAPAVTTQGNRLNLAQPFITEYHSTQADGKERVRPVGEPLPTQDCSNRFGVAQPFMATVNHGVDEKSGAPETRVKPMDGPAPTVTGENGTAVIQPFMMSAGGPECPPRSTEDPAHTVLTRDHIGIVAPYIVGAGGPAWAGEPKSIDDPVGTVIGRQTRAVVEPFTVPVTHQDPPGADPGARVRGMDEPVQAVTGAHRGELGVVQPFVAGAGGPSGQGRQPQSVDEPLGTVLAENHRALVEPFTVALKKGASASDPGEIAVVSVSMVRYTHNVLAMDPQNCLLLTMHDGSKWLLDIFFRMFRPRELARAQSFPDSYQFKGSTADIVKQVGNAVPVKIARRLCIAALTQEVVPS